MCFVYENGDKEYIAAIIDDLHRACLFENSDVFLAMMLHELGHYRNGDLNPKEDLTTEAIMNDRLSCILAGKVLEQELKADAFAVSCIGKNKFIRCLDYMINARKQRADEGMPLAIKEFELRKKAVRNMRI